MARLTLMQEKAVFNSPHRRGFTGFLPPPFPRVGLTNSSVFVVVCFVFSFINLRRTSQIVDDPCSRDYHTRSSERDRVQFVAIVV